MKKEILRKKILQKELEIKKLHLQPKSEIINELLNSLILEKAILKKELETKETNIIFSKIKSIFQKKEKLICDYFKT